MRAAALLVLLLALPAAAGENARDAIRTFENDFSPGMSRMTRSRALVPLESVDDPAILDAYDWALDLTLERVLRLTLEKDGAVKEVEKVEGQLDDIFQRESERARKEGRPPGPVTIPASLLEARQLARMKVDGLQADIDGEYDLRKDAAESFGHWIDALSAGNRVDVLKDVERHGLADPKWARRVFYVRGLSGATVPEVSRLLFTRLSKEKDERVLPVLIDSVADQAKTMALDLLLAFLSDERWQIRATTIGALGRIGTAACVPPLIARLRIEDGRLRGDIAAALRKITGQDLGINPDRWQAWWDAHGATFGKPAPAPAPGGDPAGGAKPPEEPRAPEKNSFYGITVVSHRVLFVIDVSNSMNQPAGGKDPNRTKIDVAKYELKNAILGLPDDATFNIIFYTQDVSVWQRGMVKANRRERRLAAEFIDRIRADGNTNIYDALDKAFHLVGTGATDRNYDLGADTIYLLSDGIPNRGKVTDPNAILAEVGRWNSLRRVKIHTVGVGPDHDANFLRALARSSGGQYVAR